MSSDFDNLVFTSVYEVMGERFLSLLGTYVDNTEKHIKCIYQAYQEADLDKVKSAAHPLKSSSAALGFIKISIIAEKIETISSLGATSYKIESLIKELPYALHDVKNYIANNIKTMEDISSKNKEYSNKKIKVINIDDDPIICKITRAFLSNTGVFDIETYLSVEEALIKSQYFSPDIILVDFMMPDTEGLASLLDIKADPHLADVPVVFVTGLEENEVKDKLGSGVISGYLKKPYSAETLISLIKNTCPTL